MHYNLLIIGLILSSCGSREAGQDSSLSAVETNLAAEAPAKTGRLEHMPFNLRQMPSDASTPIIKRSNPTAVTHCIYGNNVVLGISRLGGGYINFAHHKKNAASIDCKKIQAGEVANEAAGGYGRGWQSALRDRLHSGRFNPTQAGFLDGAGRPITNIDRDKVSYANLGTVQRLTFPTFQVPLFSDPVFDFTQNEDLYPDFRNEGADSIRDKDGVAAVKNGGPDGNNQDAEVRSEFDFTGGIEVWSNLVNVGEVDVFRHTYAYVYQRKPNAILQFNKDGRLEREKDENGNLLPAKPVIEKNSENRLKTLSEALAPGKEAEDTDLSGAIMAFGIRLNKSAQFNKVVTVGNDGKLVVRGIKGENNTYKVKDGGDLGNDKAFSPSMVGGRNLEVINGSVIMLCQCDSKGKGRAWALYAAPKSVNNKNQIVGSGGSKNYAEDRRFQTVMGADLKGEEGPNYDVNGGMLEAELTKIEIKTFFKGLYAPGRVSAGTREGIRQEVFILHGQPDQIVRAAAKIEKMLK